MVKLSNNQQRLLKSKIAILGLGKNNMGLFRWLLKHKVKRITVCDKDPHLRERVAKSSIAKLTARVKFQLGKDYLRNLDKFDLIIRTPGIPYLNSKIQAARYHGVQISSQTRLFFEFCPAKIIGITGTKGKGTTANLLFRILTKKFIGTEANAYLAGNIGTDPFDFLDDLKPEDEVIYELSSFQLQDMDKSPHLAIVLNITDDHLDYHKDSREYLKAKYKIVEHQRREDAAIINADYLTSFAFAGISVGEIWWFSTRKSVDKGAFVRNQKILLRTGNQTFDLMELKDLQLKGQHNLENILSAALAGYLLGAQVKEIRRVIKSFSALEHRLEPVLEKDGVVVINDSYSTNPEASVAALKAYPQSILVAGGRSKKLDFKPLGRAIARQAKKAILFGEAAEEIGETVVKGYGGLIRCQDLGEAVKKAFALAKRGDVILFSPGCASFDQFKDATERGEEFKKLTYRWL
jgi:UDP-N-acetylmuramoylalanine--D-glutamate ligase